VNFEPQRDQVSILVLLDRDKELVKSPSESATSGSVSILVLLDRDKELRSSLRKPALKIVSILVLLDRDKEPRTYLFSFDSARRFNPCFIG